MPFSRFIEVGDAIIDAREDEVKAQLQQQAHLGYQISLSFGNKWKDFQEYLRTFAPFNLPEEKPPTPEEAAAERERALRRAREIIDLDRKRQTN